ncbi:hypothetical protein COCVIDRAFT_104135, partial [Bipolaris victoriae FI3]
HTCAHMHRLRSALPHTEAAPRVPHARLPLSTAYQQGAAMLCLPQRAFLKGLSPFKAH